MLRRHRLLLVYLALLGLSWGVEALRREPTLPIGLESRAIDIDLGNGSETLRVAFRDQGPRDPGVPVAVLLHGSPGGRGDFGSLAREAARQDAELRLIIPDLPGFGASTRQVSDYGIRAHAKVLLALLDTLGVESAHVVGFSMGGGVAISAVDLAPERFRSIVLLSAIGVQEYELLGDYDLNHLVHGLQLFLLRLVDWGVPHFGALDRFPLNAFYARNFFDTDQRPLRAALEGMETPALILHGEHDPLVPIAAAREHRRLLPQSELRVFPEGHFVLWQRGPEIALLLTAFWSEVEAGRALRRADASAPRVAAAARGFSREAGTRGVLAVVAFCFLVFAASLVSEDLTCIGVGFLIARGQVEWALAVPACAAALWAGDLLLYGAGRFGARLFPAHARSRLEAARARFERSGAMLILASRFVPGARLPIYVGAGAARYPVARLAALLLLAAIAWAPLLVGGAAWFGELTLESLDSLRRGSLLALLVTAGILLLLTRIALPLLTHSGRRRLRGRFERLRRWEFWPMWAVYPPVVAYVLWLGLRHGGLRTATAANPAIPGGGFVGESKRDILRGLAASGDAVANTVFLSAEEPAGERAARVLARFGVPTADTPIVLKPDVGERGKGVVIVRDEVSLRSELDIRNEHTLAQEYIPGVEYGVFYIRHPEQERGEIFSITEKRMISVTGDGARTLRRLILDDDRAVCMAERHFERHAASLDEVPAAGEVRTLTELGTHSRGALFLDRGHLATPALRDAVDRISRGYRGFFFGRYDLRCPSEAALRGGRFRIVELNGLSSEATHMYDPKYSLWAAYRVLFRQWRIAFAIGASNRERGAEVLSWWELGRLLWRLPPTGVKPTERTGEA